MERREEQMCYELECRLIGLLQQEDYAGCFTLVEGALANPDLDMRLTRAMLVPIAHNIAWIVGNSPLIAKYAQLRERLPAHRTSPLPDTT